MKIEEKKTDNKKQINLFTIGLIMALIGGVGLNLLFIINSFIKDGLGGGIVITLFSMILWGIVTIIASMWQEL